LATSLLSSSSSFFAFLTSSLPSLARRFCGLFGAAFGQRLVQRVRLFGETEDVRRFFQKTLLMQRFNIRSTKTFNVESEARHEMAQPLHRLCGADEPASAAPVDVFLAGLLVHFAHRVTAADGAFVREGKWLCAARPLLQNDAHDLRDHVAGALHHHGVADAHVLAFDLFLVVQGRILHHHAADGEWLELGHGRELAGAADLDIDIEQGRLRLLRGEFVRDRPARRTRDKAKALLKIETVDLVDDTVDVVAKIGALAFDAAIEFQNLVRRIAAAHQRIDLEAPVFERLQHVPLRIGGHLARLAPGIGEEMERPRRCHRRIELAHRPGRRVARIDEERACRPSPVACSAP